MAIDAVLSKLAEAISDTHVQRLSALSTKGRKQMAASSFALPNKRMFPIHDAEHARKALQLVSRALAAGSITPQEAAIVRRKAQAKLRGSKS